MLATGALFSFGGLAFRSTDDASAWEYLTFRGVGMIVATAAIFSVQHRGRVHRVLARVEPIHVGAGVVLGAINAVFIVSLDLTTVAFVLFLQPIAPIFAAYFSWLFMRERVSRNVAVATPRAA